MQVQEQRNGFAAVGFDLVAVGFSPPEALAQLAEHLSWQGAFYSDPGRALYDRLEVGRASLRQVFNLGTLARYGRSLRGGARIDRPVEDIRQLGADLLVVGGVARVIARPTGPDDRPPVADLVAAAVALDGAPGGAPTH